MKIAQAEKTGRDLSLREQAHLAFMGKPDTEDVSSLIKSLDIDVPLPQLVDLIPTNDDRIPYSPTTAVMPIYGAYYSSQVGQFGQQVTSTALLDHLLERATPEERKILVREGLRQAANTPDQDIDVGHKSSRMDTTRHAIQDASGKILVLAKHGGDISSIIQASTDPSLIDRNVKLLLQNNIPISKKDAQYVFDTALHTYGGSWGYKNFSYSTPKEDLIAPLLLTGAIPKKAIPITSEVSHHTAVVFETKNPVTLALHYDRSGKTMEALLAKGEKADPMELVTVALLDKNVAALKLLKNLGYDINQKDDKGRTALTRLIQLNLTDELNPRDRYQSSAYSLYSSSFGIKENQELFKAFAEAGGDVSAKDKSGKSASDYQNDYIRPIMASAAKQEKAFIPLDVEVGRRLSLSPPSPPAP